MNEDTKNRMAAIIAAAQAKANNKPIPAFISNPISEITPVKQVITPIEVPKPEVIAPIQPMPELSNMTFADLVNDTVITAPIKLKIEIKEYSDKSFAVFGDTKPIKDKLRNMGGKFNYYLKFGPGWIFPKAKYYTVKRYLEIAA